MPGDSNRNHAPDDGRRPAKRWRTALAAVATAGLVLAACGGGSPSADKKPGKSAASAAKSKHEGTSSTGSTTSTTAPPIATSTVVIDGRTVPVPTDDGTPITPLQDSGQNVILTSRGFLPRVLYASRTAPVVYTNLTSGTVTISFPHSPASPAATIAPGASYDYTPRSMQYEYTSSTGYTAYVVVGAFTG